jgi:hypothetical protein
MPSRTLSISKWCHSYRRVWVAWRVCCWQHSELRHAGDDQLLHLEQPKLPQHRLLSAAVQRTVSRKVSFRTSSLLSGNSAGIANFGTLRVKSSTFAGNVILPFHDDSELVQDGHDVCSYQYSSTLVLDSTVFLKTIPERFQAIARVNGAALVGANRAFHKVASLAILRFNATASRFTNLTFTQPENQLSFISLSPLNNGDGSVWFCPGGRFMPLKTRLSASFTQCFFPDGTADPGTCLAGHYGETNFETQSSCTRQCTCIPVELWMS